MAVYDWVFFDQGGTLDADVKSSADDQADQLIIDRALVQWFAVMVGLDDLDVMTIKRLADEARSRIAISPGQISLQANRDYFTRWLAIIYEKVGIDRPVPLAELEAAYAYMIWQYDLSTARRASAATCQTLQHLRKKGIQLGVISNNGGYLDDILLHAGIVRFFGVTIDSARVNLLKPDPRIFHLAIDRAGAHGQRLLYVGDSYDADVIGALAAGWDVAWITSQPVNTLPPNVFPIKTLAELESLCAP
jgi:FMN phosphatase YigB (HAD superfamily)